MTLSRRGFLRVSALSAGALALAPYPALSAPRARGRPKRVLVVGAGLAGLAAALRLADHGHDVTVIEAQTRPGGRVLTERDAFADGLYADLGAARIPADHDLTLRYVERFGLTLTPF